MRKRGKNREDLIVAAQRGDRRAGDDLVRGCLPLVYNVAGRALGADPDIEDVVQETMLVVRDLGDLRLVMFASLGPTPSETAQASSVGPVVHAP